MQIKLVPLQAHGDDRGSLVSLEKGPGQDHERFINKFRTL